MKQPKKLTRNQKEYISKIKPKLDLQDYRLIKEDVNGLVIINIVTKEIKEIGYKN